MKHLDPCHFISGLILCAGLHLLAGCSPNVYTIVSKSYPEAMHGCEVIVLGLQDTLPADAEILGHVAITDTGFSTGCSYDKVIDIAKKQTIQIGGNGLHITNHKKPSFMSSCHQIEGKMLYIPCSSFLFSRPDSTQQTTIAAIATTTPEPESKSKSRKSKSTIYANAGYGFITSKFILAPGTSGDPTMGFDFNIGYNYKPTKGPWGFGAIYSRYSTSIDLMLEGGGSIKDRISLQYIAPEVTVQTTAGKHWVFRAGLGIGYTYYAEKAGNIKEGIGGFGYHLTLDGEYKFNQHIGIGLNFAEFASRFGSKMQPFNNPEGHSAGIGRVTVSGGIRLHF